MTSLSRPKLGTDPVKGWAFYQVHLASTYVLKEFFLTSNYKASISAAINESKNLERVLAEMEKVGIPVPNREAILAHSNGVKEWALEMQSEKYHDMYTHALVSMWAAFEAGMENSAAAFIQNDRRAATEATDRMKKDRFPMASWPWPRESCLSIVQILDAKAKDATPNGGVDIFNRLKTLLSWLGVDLETEDWIAPDLAEASRLRNVILHRYGEINDKDAVEVPSLAPWVGQVMPITDEKFTAYYNAISRTLVLTVSAIAKSRHVA